MKCRCGWAPYQGPHLCHRCRRRVGSQRHYVSPRPDKALSGVTLVFKPIDTWACERCWDEFLMELARAWERMKSAQ